MELKKYKEKRNFKETPEPIEKAKKGGKLLRFCVQEHHARHLHYDFRLEHQGVLLSWAVPKGPSLNPKDKRLAIHVEDHPLAYQYFEGTIPKGNYGAGTVKIWDKGTYATVETTDKKECEKIITKGLKQGHLALIMNGDVLKGEYILQKLKKDPEDKAWLLIKKKDEFSSKKSIKKKVAKLPEFISPMLATLMKEPFDSADWLFEIKWDGFRGLAFVDNGKVILKSRTNNSLNKNFPEIIENLKQIHGQAIFDGELVILDSKGRSNFQLMQNYQREKTGTLCYYVFDILLKDGVNLRDRPLIERKEILKKLLQELSLPLVRYSDHILNKGVKFFKEASKIGLEGIIGKKLLSTYQSKRSRDWVKIKTHLRQEVVIAGFTEPKGSREKFGALIIGVYDENHDLINVGHVGGGFNTKLLHELYSKFKPLIVKKCPFKNAPKTNGPVTWIKPQLVCEVSFSEWTKGNQMRQPIFQGMRIDKDPKSVVKEMAIKKPKGKTK